MFTATISQVATYLVAICLFSISFLVFINASLSFVITKIIDQKDGVGDAVGSLGFADEVVAIVACPLWGLLSDYIGVRPVCGLAYAIIGISLLLFVQAHDVMPQLLLARLLFSIGASGTSTMITAILPTMTANHQEKDLTSSQSFQGPQDSVLPVSSEATITSPPDPVMRKSSSLPSPTRSAGLVGLFSGCGALLALLVFLRLPDLIEGSGVDPVNALKDSYYIVGSSALVLSAISLLGLRNLQGEAGKGWAALFRPTFKKKDRRYRGTYLLEAISLGFRIPSLGLAYLGGFVARASSIGITLFIPLLVNTYFISSGLCDDWEGETADTKENCRSAYRLTAILTGVSQLVGLISAPVFGFLADRYRRSNMLLLLAAILGVFAYLALATLKSPKAEGEDGTPWIFLIMALLGINQIGAIVCSLGILGRCVLEIRKADQRDGVHSSDNNTSTPQDSQRIDPRVNNEGNLESEPLLGHESHPRDLQHLKGSIAGVYSLTGGLGILLLTKIGGLLFDQDSAAPFLMLSAFNALLFLAGVICWLSMVWQRKATLNTSRN